MIVQTQSASTCARLRFSGVSTRGSDGASSRDRRTSASSRDPPCGGEPNAGAILPACCQLRCCWRRGFLPADLKLAPFGSPVLLQFRKLPVPSKAAGPADALWQCQCGTRKELQPFEYVALRNRQTYQIEIRGRSDLQKFRLHIQMLDHGNQIVGSKCRSDRLQLIIGACGLAQRLLGTAVGAASVRPKPIEQAF